MARHFKDHERMLPGLPAWHRKQDRLFRASLSEEEYARISEIIAESYSRVLVRKSQTEDRAETPPKEQILGQRNFDEYQQERVTCVFDAAVATWLLSEEVSDDERSKHFSRAIISAAVLAKTRPDHAIVSAPITREFEHSLERIGCTGVVDLDQTLTRSIVRRISASANPDDMDPIAWEDDYFQLPEPATV